MVVRTVLVYYHGLKGLTDVSTCLKPRKWATFLWRPGRSVVERTSTWWNRLLPHKLETLKATEFLDPDAGAPLSFEASVTVYQLARRNVPEDLNFRKFWWFRTWRVPTPFQYLVSICTEIRVSKKWTANLKSKKSTSHAFGIGTRFVWSSGENLRCCSGCYARNPEILCRSWHEMNTD